MTDRKFPRYSEDVLRLMDDPRDLVPAAAIAPILKMNPQVIVKRAKSGEWPEGVCKCVTSGGRVKFYRLDFLRKGGWLADEPPEPVRTERELLEELIGIAREILAEMKRPASVAAPADKMDDGGLI